MVNFSVRAMIGKQQKNAMEDMENKKKPAQEESSTVLVTVCKIKKSELRIFPDLHASNVDFLASPSRTPNSSGPAAASSSFS